MHIILSLKLLSCTIMNILNAVKSVIIQLDIPYSSITAFNLGVLLSVTQLDKHDLNAFTYSHF